MSALTPGLTSPLAAQACFRAILSAFSRPGAIIALPIELAPPPGLSPAAAAVLLTLADATTGIALPAPGEVRDWLVFHTGARLVSEGEAVFCVARQCPELPGLLQGTDEAPEGGATLILEVEALGAGPNYRLSGPGLEHALEMPLPVDGYFLAQWQAQTSAAPRGVDVLLCAGNSLLALPRSLRIEAA